MVYVGPMHEADEEISEIKTEIIEARGLVIKTNNLISSLAADLKAIAKRQVLYERRATWNSAVAYVLFALLWSVGLKLWSDVRIDEIESEKAALHREVDILRNERSAQVRRQQGREEAVARAREHYALIRDRAYVEAVNHYPQLSQLALSSVEAAFFQDTDRVFRAELSVRAFRAGRSLVRAERYTEAVEALRSALDYQSAESALQPEIQLELATALSLLGRHGEAAALAKEVLAQGRNRELQDDAALLLARCAAALGEVKEARDAYTSLLRRWPSSVLAVEARRGLSEVNRTYLASGAQP